MAAVCAEKGVVMIDAPISGGPAGAAAGTLAVMVSGDPVRAAELRPVFECW
jgi:3-hydroxyisobutyrate dehydrogenase-like beta-hydroxyacid dehydrogenase